MNRLVLFSGGQDSTTCLAIACALSTGNEKVHTISAMYGQKHQEAEAKAIEKITQYFNVSHTWVDLRVLGQFADSGLIEATVDVSESSKVIPTLPASYVPHRNLLLLTFAHMFAIQNGYGQIYIGANQEDYSGYPDCRHEFLNKADKLLNLSSAGAPYVSIQVPLLHLTKAEIFYKAKALGCLNLILEETHTCYRGDTTPHDWGHGCGDCPACKIREKGWNEYREKYREVK